MQTLVIPALGNQTLDLLTAQPTHEPQASERTVSKTKADGSRGMTLETDLFMSPHM